VAATNIGVYPDWTLQDWLVAVKRSHKITPEGVIVADYDANIAQPFKLPGGEAGVDLWPAFESLVDTPTLIVRGALSDILGAATADKMLSRLHKGSQVTVPGVGHAPTLDEPQAVEAIDSLMAGVAG
jgi:pimeloyl-ACP methyl ester carboxylesterase